MAKAIMEAVVKSPPAQPWDIDCSADPVLVKQEFVKESDVNVIIASCLRRGVELPGADVRAVFADVSKVGDFAGLQGQLVEAQEAFASLDANLRARFGNSPAALLAFLADESNRPEAEKLGLLEPKKVEAPPAAVPPVVPAAATPGAATAVPPVAA